MSFAEVEVSADRGEPAELYLFSYDTENDGVLAYTDAEDAIVFEGRTYQPIPIDRDAITSSGTLDKASIEIRAPQDGGLADLFRLYPPSQVVGLIIRQGHLNDPSSQFLVIWSGRVIGFAIENEEAKYTCEPITTSLKRAGLRRNYQYGCPHVLYGAQCRADRASATAGFVTVGATSGATVNLATDWVPDATKLLYEGGIARWTTAEGRSETRTILRAYPDGRVLLTGYATGLPLGGTVYLSRGCDHLMTGCLSHNNILNFGGQPWIPLKTPIGIRNIYY